MTLKAILEKQLQDLENQIRELEDRLPAHSVKPTMMMELLTLEEKREGILAKIRSLKVQPAEK